MMFEDEYDIPSSDDLQSPDDGVIEPMTLTDVAELQANYLSQSCFSQKTFDVNLNLILSQLPAQNEVIRSSSYTVFVFERVSNPPIFYLPPLNLSYVGGEVERGKVINAIQETVLEEYNTDNNLIVSIKEAGFIGSVGVRGRSQIMVSRVSIGYFKFAGGVGHMVTYVKAPGDLQSVKVDPREYGGPQSMFNNTDCAALSLAIGITASQKILSNSKSHLSSVEIANQAKSRVATDFNCAKLYPTDRTLPGTMSRVKAIYTKNTKFEDTGVKNDTSFTTFHKKK